MGQAQIQSVADERSDRLISRAFHASQLTDGDVVISGGWIQAPSTNTPCVNDSDCPNGQCYSLRCTEGSFNPVALHGAREWVRYHSDTQRFESGGLNAAARIGVIGVREDRAV